MSMLRNSPDTQDTGYNPFEDQIDLVNMLSSSNDYTLTKEVASLSLVWTQLEINKIKTDIIINTLMYNAFICII